MAYLTKCVLMCCVFATHDGATATSIETDLRLPACPTGYTNYSSMTGACYKHMGVKTNWKDARQLCQSDGGDLPVIHDMNSNMNIQRLWTLWQLPPIWIGFEKILGTSLFKWVDGNPMVYNRFERSAPMQADGSVNDGNCGIFEDSFWMDGPCTMDKEFICQKRASIFPTCLSGYALNGIRKTCIKIVKSKETWESARQVCNSDGGDLVTVPDKASHDFLNILTSDGFHYWVGASAYTKDPIAVNLTDYRWLNGNQFEIEDWAKVSWNSSVHNAGCITVKLEGDSWTNFECRDRNRFICEKDVYKPTFCSKEGWTKNPRNEMCYKTFRYNKRWHSSRSVCQNYGGDLVTMTDSHIEDYIEGLIIPDMPKYQRYWVGLTDFRKRNEYEWIDGNDFKSSRRKEFNGWNQRCGTIKVEQQSQPLLKYMDLNCGKDLPFICHKEQSLDYPLLTCPHGYTTYITAAATGSHIVCLMAEHVTSMTYTESRKTCQKAGGDLYQPDLNNELDLHLFVSENLISEDRWYWAQEMEPDCKTYYKSTVILSTPGSCIGSNMFICRHMGSIKTMVNVEEVRLLTNIITLNDIRGESVTGSLTEICTSHGRTFENTTSAYGQIVVDLNHLLEQHDQMKCFGTFRHIPKCCSEVILPNKIENNTQVEIKVQFPIDRLDCLCAAESTTTHTNATVTMRPGIDVDTTNIEISTSSSETNILSSSEPNFTTNIMPTTTRTTTINITDNKSKTTVDYPGGSLTPKPPTRPPPPSLPQDPIPMSQESVELLRKFASFQNTNVSCSLPSKLCPCRCESVKFDPNPSPEILDKILAKIARELKVEPQKLSKKRNSKISAPDSRVGSQIIGYISVAFCLIPFAIIVGTDLLRVFQYFERERTILKPSGGAGSKTEPDLSDVGNMTTGTNVVLDSEDCVNLNGGGVVRE